MAIIDAQHCAMRPPEREPAIVGVVYSPPGSWVKGYGLLWGERWVVRGERLWVERMGCCG